MDDILTSSKTYSKELTTVKELVPLVELKTKSSQEDKTHPLEPTAPVYLLPNVNVKGRYLALKSPNDRQVVATGFTRTRVLKKAHQKGYSSCIVIANE